MRAIGRFFSGILNFILYIVVIIICVAAILGVLVWQCRVNIPIAPGWKFMPKIAANYWNWLDDWQMERCPKLAPDNYFFGDEPVPAFDESGELVFEPECSPSVITFNPRSAPVGTFINISLDGFMPEETVRACWYLPLTTSTDDCLDLQTDENGHLETGYTSDKSYPKGVYRMEVQDSCALVSQEFTLE